MSRWNTGFALLFTFAFTLSLGCASMKGLYQKAEIHKKMSEKVQAEGVELSVGEAKEKLDGFLNRGVSGGNWIVVSSPESRDEKKMEEINKVMEEGFFYKEKFYSSNIDLDADLFKKASFKDHILKARYHVLESNDEGFLAVKGSTIFEAKKLVSGRTVITISKLTNVYRPKKLNFDWWGLFTKNRGGFEFKETPPDFEKSRKFAKYDQGQTLDFYYFADPVGAKKMEADLAARM